MKRLGRNDLYCPTREGRRASHLAEPRTPVYLWRGVSVYFDYEERAFVVVCQISTYPHCLITTRFYILKKNIYYRSSMGCGYVDMSAKPPFVLSLVRACISFLSHFVECG